MQASFATASLPCVFPCRFLATWNLAAWSTHRPMALVWQMVAGSWGHKTGHTAEASGDLLVPVPAALDPVLGIVVGQMGPIAANGILHADALAHGRTPVDFGASVAGRRVIVWGGGTVGMMIALFANTAGAAEVVVVV